MEKNKKDKSSSGYGSFIKSNRTLNSEDVDDIDGAEDNAIPKKEDVPKPDLLSSVMSDEALFKACGGRTAHK